MAKVIKLEETTNWSDLLTKILKEAHVTDRVRVSYSAKQRNQKQTQLIELINEVYTKDIKEIEILRKEEEIQGFGVMEIGQKRCIIKGGSIVPTLALAEERQRVEKNLLGESKEKKKKILNQFYELQRMDRGDREKQEELVRNYREKTDMESIRDLGDLGQRMGA